MSVLRDLPNQMLAVIIGHPIFGFNAFVTRKFCFKVFFKMFDIHYRNFYAWQIYSKIQNDFYHIFVRTYPDTEYPP
jgi:hypothetical protein